MAQTALVMKQIEDGDTLLRKLKSNHFDVAAACWLFDNEIDEWSLYIASRNVDQQGLVEAYKEFHRTLNTLPELWIDPLAVKLVGVNHPIAKDISDLHARFPVNLLAHYRLKELGGIPISEAHVYPPVL